MRQDACLFIAAPTEGKGEKGRKGEGKVRQEIEIVGEKALGKCLVGFMQESLIA